MGSSKDVFLWEKGGGKKGLINIWQSQDFPKQYRYTRESPTPHMGGGGNLLLTQIEG